MVGILYDGNSVMHILKYINDENYAMHILECMTYFKKKLSCAFTNGGLHI